MSSAIAPARTARGMAKELRRAARVLEPGSAVRFCRDVVDYRVLRFAHPSNRPRASTTRDGVTLEYRSNRGDIQSVREVWLDEVYRLPATFVPRTIVDLGAHIGLTSLWYATRYAIDRVVAVEPDPDNAAVAQANLERTEVPFEILHAAVGPERGEAGFARDERSNMGHLSDDGALRVPVITMDDVLDRVGGFADLVKMDIEGGEGPLLTGDVSWLDRIRALIAEFHPETVAYDDLVRLLESRGLRRVTGGWDVDENDLFIRDVDRCLG